MKFLGASSIVLLASFAPASYAFLFFPSSNILKQQRKYSRSFITNKSFGITSSSTGSTSGDIGATTDETDKEGGLTRVLNGFFKRQGMQLQQQSSSVNAKDILVQLVRNRNCYSTVEGAKEFAETCADDIIYEDCYLADPVVGKKVGDKGALLFFFDSKYIILYMKSRPSCCIASWNHFAHHRSTGSGSPHTVQS